MSTYFIVSTPTECPAVYVSQKPFEEVLRSMRAFPYSHTRRAFVFEMRPLPQGADPDATPSGCVQLCLIGRVDQTDPAESYQYLLGCALDDLPADQAITKAQQALDYLNKKVVQYEGKTKEIVSRCKEVMNAQTHTD